MLSPRPRGFRCALAGLLLPLASVSCDASSAVDGATDACAAQRDDCAEAGTEPDTGGPEAAEPDPPADGEKDSGSSPADASAPAADARPSVDAHVATGRCGDGVVQGDIGEVCDGPRFTETGDRVGCSKDCRTLIERDACEECQERACTRYEDVDLVAGCFTKIDPQFNADPKDGKFLSECRAAVNCALATGCAFQDPLKRAMSCYCGSASLDDCQAAPAADAACGSAWRNAARATNAATAFGNMSNLEYPAAWAYELFDCYLDHCHDVCATR